ncbi:hypothetical protein BABINDRAFT_160557, partial [Babjeviella inositovora NRRL Y-12698]
MLRKSAEKLIKSLPTLAETPNKYNKVRSAWNLKPNLPQGLYHHPAPSAKSPLYETPNAFLPESDPRKNLPHILKSYEFSQEALSNMPLLQDDVASRPQYHLTAEHVAEIQSLRAQDPEAWSFTKLAKKFDTTVYFIRIAIANMDKSLGRQKAAAPVTADSEKTKYELKRELINHHRKLRREAWLRD